MKRLMRLSLYIALTLFFGACTTKVPPDYFNKICRDTSWFNVDTSRGSFVYYTKVTSEYLSLQPLSTPSDTFFLRVQYSTDTTFNLFQYAFYNSQTEYKIYRFPLENRGRIMYNSNKNQPTDFAQLVEYHGQDMKFIQQLEENKILELNVDKEKNMYLVGDERSDVADGIMYDSYEIEFSNKCAYSLKTFLNITKNSSQLPEANRALKFINYLKKDFKF